MNAAGGNGDDAPTRPFVAPCRRVPATAPLRWVAAGWRDLRRAWPASLAYGLFLVATSWAMILLAFRMGSYVLVLSLLSGFVFLGPVLALGLYSLSRQIGRGERPSLARSLAAGRRHLGNEMVFALVLLIVFLVWARAASMIHVFFPVEADPGPRELLVFLGVGSAVGSIFAAITFAASAFSLPMMIDREVDTVTAVVTSINAVLRNKGPMGVWVALIVGLTGLGFLTAFLGLAVALPLLGHATWHAYTETIDASAWPPTRRPGAAQA